LRKAKPLDERGYSLRYKFVNFGAEQGQFFKLPGLVKLTNTKPFAAWFVVTVGEPT
jgi:hypothetical protein